MNSTTVVRIEQLYPPLKVKAYQLIQTLSIQGIEVEVSQGLRTWPEQMTLYNQGRTLPGPIVTNASPSQSWHTFGMAFDIDIVTDHGLDWTGDDAAWNVTISTGESLSLYAGALFRSFPDKPHFQWKACPVSPDDMIVSIFKGGGLSKVWKYIDALTQAAEATQSSSPQPPSR